MAVVGCGDGGGLPSNNGGKGGGAAGGRGGGVAGEGGQAAGGPGGGAGQLGSTGGSAAAGGAAGAGVAGAAGSPASTGGAGGGPNPCGTAPPLCVAGAKMCAAGVPQLCVADANGCTNWQAQPTCSANQACDATTGGCVCNNDPACGATPSAGDFCPTAGSATHSTCVKQADGCFTVVSGVACGAGQTCNVGSATTIVPVNTACGCPPVGADQTGVSAKLLGTGCSMADATAARRVGSASDDAVLVCVVTNACPTWQLSVSCATQQLTGGLDPGTSLPACVCKAPAKAGQYFVDPDPAMSTFMTGSPTGAQFPAACRFRTLTTALKQTTPAPTEVIAQHESSSNVHFKTRIGTPGGLSCTAPNSCETFPIEVPAGVHLYTSDVGSFNPAHYIIDVDETNPKPGYAILLNDRVTFEGYTVDASGSNTSGINAASGVSVILASPAKGAWMTTAAVAPVTATVNQVLLLGGITASSVAASPVADNLAAAPAALIDQTGLLLRGQARWTTSFLSIIGGVRLTRGIQVDHSTDNVTGSTATLTATHLSINLAPPSGAGLLDAIGVEVGIGDVGAPAAADGGIVVTISNDAIDRAGGRAISVSPGAGVVVRGGTVTTNGLDVGGIAPSGANTFVGYLVLGTNSPAAMGLNINQGAVRGQASSGTGVWSLGGLTTINGAHITAGGTDDWVGVSVSQAVGGDSNVAGDVTLTGTATARTIVDSAPFVNGTAPVGIRVGGDLEVTSYLEAGQAPTNLSRLTIADHTTVTGFGDGMVIHNGRVISNGADVSFTGNWRDGIQIFSSLDVPSTNPAEPLSRVVVNGASITGNGRLGVLVRDVVPVTLDNVKVTNNGTPIAASHLTFPDGTGGIDVQRSQITGSTAFLFTLSNSRVSNNRGCGVTLSGGDDDLVNRTSRTAGGVRLCGVGIYGGLSEVDATSGLIPASQDLGPAGAFGGPTDAGGKVSATLLNNFVQNNTGVGIYVTEARDEEPTAGGADDVTEATIQGNKVTGNLTLVLPTGTEPTAGGIYVAASDFTEIRCTGTACTTALNTTRTTNDVGCEDIATVSGGVKVHRSCTRVRMSTFLGNTVECNGRAQLSFAIPQRVASSADGSGWDIGSNGSLVGVTLGDRCLAVATPNTLAGYSSSLQDSSGLVIPGSATDPATQQSLIHVAAYGVYWNTSTLAAGTDYSASLAGSPQGNGDATSWGLCPAAAAVTCPIAVTP